MSVTHVKDFTHRTLSKDDVSQHHIEYDQHVHQVRLINDVYDGIDSAVQYLFSFPQEIPETFETRQARATLRNFVKRAVQAFTGMIFRKPLEIDGYGLRTTKLFKTIDTNQTIENFTKEITGALTKDGVTYILADSPQKGTDGKPYLMHIDRSQVINWRKDEYGRYTMVVIEEIVAEPYGEFGTEYIKQWRVYKLIEKTVTITLYRANTAGATTTKIKTTKLNTGTYVAADPIETEFNSIPLIEIVVDKTPILYDIAKLNVKHLNRLSHKDRYLTMAALPIPVIWGADVDDHGNTNTAKPALVIGVDEAFIFSSKEEGDFQWRELSGDSIDQLENDLNSIVEDITTGILRAAESANSVQKTATEVQLLQAEASNRVTAIANAVEVGMKTALVILSEINNEAVPEKAAFIINKDFNAALMGSDGARIVMESYLTGMISMETYLQAMSDMELINIDSAKDEIARIAADNFVPVPKIAPTEKTVSDKTDNKSELKDDGKTDKEKADKKLDKKTDEKPKE